MTLYLVHMPGGGAQVKGTFPLHHTIIEDQLWAIGSDLLTCADVCAQLGMRPNGPGGVVVKFDEYYGAFDPALWERLKAWGGGR